MKKTILKSIAFLLLTISIASCGEVKNEDTTGSSEAIQELFKEVKQVHVWKSVDGMGSPPYIITDPEEIKKFIALIGEQTEQKTECKFTGGIKFITTLNEKVESGETIFMETNLSDACTSLNFFNKEGQMEHHTITPEGVKMLKNIYSEIKNPGE